MNQEILLNVESKETRCAFLKNGQLQDLVIERKNSRQLTGNIYRGRVTNILHNIQSAFIDINEGEVGATKGVGLVGVFVDGGAVGVTGGGVVNRFHVNGEGVITTKVCTIPDLKLKVGIVRAVFVGTGLKLQLTNIGDGDV